MSEFWQVATELAHAGESFVVVTLVSSRGHAPQDPGAKAIIDARGLRWGTIGGGKVEARAILYSKELLAGNRSTGAGPVYITWNLQSDIGMTCGGEVSFLFEVHATPNWKIALFGAGHCAQALVRTLLPLDCQITCMDSRPEWVERLPASPKLKAQVAAEPSTLVPNFTDKHFFVIMTQGHATDMPILEAVLKRYPNAPYIGSIGSDVKALKIRKELKERGVDPAVIERLRCPIGLEIGGNAPAEIAISVAAQLLEARGRI